MTLRVYTTDLTFYDGYMDKLIQEASTGFSHAILRLRACVPRLANMDAAVIAAAHLTIDDARTVYACEHGFDDWEAFTAYVASVDSGDIDDPFPAFIQAVEQGDTVVVDSLLDADPNLVQHVASTGKSSLHSIANVEMATILIARGAPPALETPLSGGTALIHALVWGNTEVADVLSGESLTPGNLRVAAGLGRLDLLEKMWDADGSLTPQARAGREYYRPNYGWFAWTPSDDEQEVLDEALVYAATNGRIEAAQYLVDRGADVNGFAYQTTALHRATWKGHAGMVEWLLDRGVSIDTRGWLGGHVQGGTALHIAANSGHLELARILVARGANVTARDAMYEGAPDGWAQHHNHPEVRDLLRPLREARETRTNGDAIWPWSHR